MNRRQEALLHDLDQLDTMSPEGMRHMHNRLTVRALGWLGTMAGLAGSVPAYNHLVHDLHNASVAETVLVVGTELVGTLWAGRNLLDNTSAGFVVATHMSATKTPSPFEGPPTT